MPGKRPRYIRRTTSVSYLGPGNSVSSDSPEQRAASPLLFPCGYADQACGVVTHALGNMKEAERATLHTMEGNPMNGMPYSYGQSVGSMESNDATLSHDSGTESRQNERKKVCSKMSEAADSETLVLDDSELELMTGSSFLSSFGKIGLETNRFPMPVSFLDACFYCKRRLGLGRDIYIYRGDRAFCSVECRYYQMAMDDGKEKCRARKEISAS